MIRRGTRGGTAGPGRQFASIGRFFRRQQTENGPPQNCKILREIIARRLPTSIVSFRGGHLLRTLLRYTIRLHRCRAEAVGNRAWERHSLREKPCRHRLRQDRCRPPGHRLCDTHRAYRDSVASVVSQEVTRFMTGPIQTSAVDVLPIKVSVFEGVSRFADCTLLAYQTRSRGYDEDAPTREIIVHLSSNRHPGCPPSVAEVSGCMLEGIESRPNSALLWGVLLGQLHRQMCGHSLRVMRMSG